MTRHIDGVAADGWTYEGDSRRAPFMVFDDDAQENVAGPYRLRWMALLARAHPRLAQILPTTDHPKEPE